MFHIALNTFREIIRSKFFLLIFLLGIVFLGIILFLNTLALNQPNFIVVDFGLSFIEITGLFLILFLGNRMLSREFEEKTIYLTLSRPIGRRKIIFGKFLGFATILLLSILIQSFLLFGLMIFFSVSITPIILGAICGIFLKQLILLALMLFFSIFLSSSIATFVVLSVYIIAHSGYALLEYAKIRENSFFGELADGILFLFPNFEALNIKNFVHLTQFPDMWHFLGIYFFAFIYLFVILFASSWVFQKKSFDNI